MTFQEFTKIVEQMKRGSVPKRLVFLFRGKVSSLKEISEGIEIHHHDLASAFNDDQPNDSKRNLEGYLQGVCKNYENERNEPSVLILENALLLPRYGCNLTPFFQYAISPRSAVLMIIPPDSKRELPIGTEGWAMRNTQAILTQLTKQLSISDCVVTS